ncbi:MAG: alanine racemase [Kiloniellales bacterium]
MIAPRVEIAPDKIRHNTRCLVDRLKPRGIDVTGVTKAVCGHPAVAIAMLEGGAIGLADARISNIERMRNAGITCPISMIRTPMLSQVDQVVESCDVSYNTEPAVVAELAAAAQRRRIVHNVILMVEMGDMREGISPKNLDSIARCVFETPGVALKGIGTNFSCLNKVAPNSSVMAELSSLVSDIEESCGSGLETVSGGNSSSLTWALGSGPTGRTNNLRLGEAILLGVDPLSHQRISGLHNDAFTLAAEVIETTTKSEAILLQIVDSGFSSLRLLPEDHQRTRIILAIGLQDTDARGLTFPAGITFIGATSDHLIVDAPDCRMRPGCEMKIQMNYTALMRAMSAPDIVQVLHDDTPLPRLELVEHSRPDLASM